MGTFLCVVVGTVVSTLYTHVCAHAHAPSVTHTCMRTRACTRTRARTCARSGQPAALETTEQCCRKLLNSGALGALLGVENLGGRWGLRSNTPSATSRELQPPWGGACGQTDDRRASRKADPGKRLWGSREPNRAICGGRAPKSEPVRRVGCRVQPGGGSGEKETGSRAGGGGVRVLVYRSLLHKRRRDRASLTPVTVFNVKNWVRFPGVLVQAANGPQSVRVVRPASERCHDSGALGGSRPAPEGNRCLSLELQPLDS